jgi:hypothetical protein
MLGFFKHFRRKKIGEKLPYLTKSEAKLWKKLITTMVFDKNAIFFAENWRKSKKIVITTLVFEKKPCTYFA